MTTYTYQGDGAYLPGIPARDLDERDVARLTEDQVDSLKTKGPDGKQLYVKKSVPKGSDAKPAE